MEIKEHVYDLGINNYNVSVKLFIPDNFQKALIIANGAGANMDSAFILNYAQKFSKNGLLTVRFNFHYQEIGRKFPDKNEKCQETYLGVIKYLANNYISEENIVIAGKSMGGRIATQIAGKVICEKIVVFGYPLHPPGKPEKLRDEHLYPINQHVLFIQGENDAFGTKKELQSIVSKMKNVQTYFIFQGNHSLKTSKKSGLDNTEIEKIIIQEVSKFVKK